VCVFFCVADCRPGYAGANCTACDKGKVRTGVASADASLTCSACPEGQTTDGTGKTSCSRCLEGWGGDGTTCSLCPKGSFREGEGLNATCSSFCPIGSTTASTGATSSSNCSRCLPGYGGSSCTPCGERPQWGGIGFWSVKDTASLQQRLQVYTA
jgi:hypothetical protein